MSYRPYNRNVSGIFYLGDQGADAPLQTTSDIIISDGGGANTYIQSANLVVADGGNIGSVTSKDAIAIASNGNVTFDQSVSISQNLTVNGTLTTIATEYFTVQDPLIYLGSGNAADVNDLGFFAEYSDDAGTTPEYAGLFRDATDEKFRLFHSLEEEPSTTVNTGGTGYTVATLVADLEGDVTGNVTGNADTATEATNVTLTANQTTNETVYLTFADGATGTQGLETDTALNYNPSTDTLTAGTLAGNVTGDLTGNADTATALETARDFSITGEGTAAAVSFDGTAAVALSFGLDETAISNQTAKGTAAVGADTLLILDSQDSNSFKKITRTNFISGLGGFNNFIVTDSGNAQNTIGDGAELEFQDGDTITFTVFNTNPFGVYVSGNIPDQGVTETQLNTSVAGDGIAGGGGTALSVNTGAGLEIDSDAVRIATSAAGDGIAGGGGSALALDFSDLATTDTTVGGSDLVSIHDGAQKKITFTNFVGQIDHDALNNFVGNEHIDHTTVDIITGSGISGGGDISATRSLIGVATSGLIAAGVGIIPSLTDYTTQTVVPGARSSTADRSYMLHIDSNGHLGVNVPWAALTTEEVQDVVGDQIVTNGSHTLISFVYDDAGDGAIDATVDNDLSNYDNSTSNFFDTAGIGLASTTNTVNLDINGLTGGTLAGGDSFAFNDADDSNTAKKVLWSTMVDGAAGVGLSSSAAVLALDFTELTDQTSVGSGDIFVGTRGTDESQWTISELGSFLAGDNITVSGDGRLSAAASTSFTVAGDTGSSTIANGDTLTIAGGATNGIDTSESAGTVTISLDISELPNLTTPVIADAYAINDGGVASKISHSNLVNTLASTGLESDGAVGIRIATAAAGNGLTGGGGSALAVNVGAGLEIDTDAVRIAAAAAGDGLAGGAGSALSVNVDDSTIEIATDTVQVKDGGITFAKMEAATIVTEAEGIDNNDNDTTLPTSAAVKDYVDNLSGLSVVTQTAASLTVTTEDVVLCDTSSNTITVTLPENGGDVGSGRRVTVKKTTSDGNTVTISRQTADTIDGATTYVLYSDNESASFVCDGSNWFIV